MNTRAAARAFLVAVLVASPLALAAETASGSQPLTHEALWLMKRVGAPGALARTASGSSSRSPSRPTTRRRRSSDLWIVPADGSAAPRRLTSAKAGESGAGLEPGQPPHRLHREARGRRGRPDLRARRRRRGRGPARHVVARWPRARRAGARTGVDPVPERRLSGRGRRRGQQEDRRRAQGRRSRRSASTTASPSGAGTSGWTTRRARLFVMPADGEGEARDLLAGTQLAGQPGFGGAQRRRLHARTSRRPGRPTARPSSSWPPPTATPPPTRP